MNSGYNGWGRGFEDFTWKDIHDSAVASNVLLVDGENHLEKGADGVVESLLADGFGYVCGRASRAFEGTTAHNRSFAFVHPQDGAPGWFFLVDEVENPGQRLNVALHPASADVSTDIPDEAYTWKIRRRKPTDTYLTIHLATSPSAVEMRDGPLTGHSQSFIGKYLYATYPASGHRASVLTLLLPHDDDHPRPAITRLSVGDVSAARLEHASGASDIIASAASERSHETEGAEWDGRSMLYRRINDTLAFAFLRLGTRFQWQNTGFESDRPVSLLLSESNVSLTSAGGCQITFRSPNLQSILVDGLDAESTTVELRPGSHTLSLIS